MGNTGPKSAETMLVLRCQSGDIAAFDELLRSVQTNLWRYVANLTRRDDLADDILQNIFLIIYKKIGWLADPEMFRPWAYRIASREAFRILKKSSGRRERSLDDEMFHLSVEHELDKDAGAILPQMLDKLTPASRAVIALHYLDGFTLNEVAEILDIPAGTVKSRLSYGLNAMRRSLGTAL